MAFWNRRKKEPAVSLPDPDEFDPTPYDVETEEPEHDEVPDETDDDEDEPA